MITVDPRDAEIQTIAARVIRKVLLPRLVDRDVAAAMGLVTGLVPPERLRRLVSPAEVAAVLGVPNALAEAAIAFSEPKALAAALLRTKPAVVFGNLLVQYVQPGCLAVMLVEFATEAEKREVLAAVTRVLRQRARPRGGRPRSPARALLALGVHTRLERATDVRAAWKTLGTFRALGYRVLPFPRHLNDPRALTAYALGLVGDVDEDMDYHDHDMLDRARDTVDRYLRTARRLLWDAVEDQPRGLVFGESESERAACGLAHALRTRMRLRAANERTHVDIARL
jgi:hypothetical protein